MQCRCVDVDGGWSRDLERRVCEGKVLTRGYGSHEESYGRVEAQGLELYCEIVSTELTE